MFQAVWWGIEGAWLEIEGQGCPGRKMTASQAKGAACGESGGGGGRAAGPAAKDYCAGVGMQSSVLLIRRGLTGQ